MENGHVVQRAVPGAVAVVLVVSASLVTGTAQAQALEEIVVTAERRETLLQDTPLSVAAFTPEALEAAVVTDFYDLQSIAPNLNIAPTRGNGGSAPSFNIRGIGGGGGPGLDTDSGVALYIDDVYFPSIARNALRTVDIESIEVLRGPQGTLFGRNSTGGAIRITTRKPSEEFYSDVTLRAGNFGRADLEATLNAPLGENFFFKGDIASLNRDGYVTRRGVSGDQATLGQVDDTIASLAFRWVPDDSMTVDFKIRAEQTRGNPSSRDMEELDIMTAPLGAHIAQLNRQLINNGEPALVQNDPRLLLDDYTVSGYCFLVDMDPLSWESDCATWDDSDNRQYTGALTWDLNENHGLQVTFGRHDVSNSEATDWITYGAEIRYRDYEGDATMLEVLLNSALAGGAIDLVSGINYYDTTRSTSQHVLRNQNNDNGDADTRDIWGDTFSGTAFGVFAEGVYHFPNGATNLTVGLRNTNEDASFHMREWESGDFNITGWNNCETASRTTGQVVRDPNCLWETTGDEGWSETDYRFVLDHDVSDQAMIYGSLSKAYRAGAFNHDGAMGLSAIDPATYELNAIEPEKVISTEVGMRTNWLEDRLRLNLTYFDMDFTNRQGAMLVTTGDSAVVEIVNLGDVSSKGWELDFAVAATDDLTISLSAGGTDAIILDPSPPGTVFITSAPELSYNLSLSHRADVGAGSLSTNLNYAWQDEFYNHSSENTDQSYTTPARGLLNGRIAWFLPDQALTVALEGTNLTDQVYGRWHSKFARFFHGGRPGNRPNTENYGIFTDRGPPRMISLSLTKDFGTR